MQLEARPESKWYDNADLGSKSQKESFILAPGSFCSDPRQGYSLIFQGFRQPHINVKMRVPK